MGDVNLRLRRKTGKNRRRNFKMIDFWPGTAILRLQETRRNGMSFGQQLAAVRRQTGLTQEQFAEELCVSRQAVSKWESGVSHS